MCAVWCYVREMIIDTEMTCPTCTLRMQHRGQVCETCPHLVACPAGGYDCRISWRRVAPEAPACCHWRQELGEVHPHRADPVLVEDYGGHWELLWSDLGWQVMDGEPMGPFPVRMPLAYGEDCGSV